MTSCGMSNALVRETSPYLLQHAGNPVDWQPWGEAAFALARERGVPVFLSVGYSTCHWCHVMERESFEDPQVADVLNRGFVPVKVDREERPDVDAVYMSFVQATTGQGGWPMSVWLTPEGEPLFGGTYFPPEDRGGRAGLVRICGEIVELWNRDRETIGVRARELMERLRAREEAVEAGGGLSPAVFGGYVDVCRSFADRESGGFGGAPKFPRPVVLDALLRVAERFPGSVGDEVRELVLHTLRAMAAGGMQDHLGGGFHRYSVDRYWHVPHYEKMLYDQAQLASVYLDGWQVSGDPMMRDTAEGIFRYVLRDMTDAGGAFHAAEDADSLPHVGATEKREGAYWTWRKDEIVTILGVDDAAVFCAAYGVEAGGNARPESDPHGELGGYNTLFRAVGDEELAAAQGLGVEEIGSRLAEMRGKLLAQRAGRPMPHRDDKIITAWNGLMIGALARGARVLDRADLAEAAVRAAEFLHDSLWDGGVLYRSFRGRRGDVAGFPADHAYLISGLLELAGLPGYGRWIEWAVELQEAMDRAHWSGERCGYVLRPELGGRVLMEMREDHDGAEPAANHVAAGNLLRLAELTGRSGWRERALEIISAGAERMEEQPFAVPGLLAAYDQADRGLVKLEAGTAVDGALRGELRRSYLPNVVWADGGNGDEVLVCVHDRCLAPARTVGEWRDRMREAVGG